MAIFNFFDSSTNTDPAMRKKGWAPLVALLAVVGLTLFLAGDAYGTKQLLRKSNDADTFLDLRGYPGYMSLPGAMCANAPDSDLDVCECLVVNCQAQINACNLQTGKGGCATIADEKRTACEKNNKAKSTGLDKCIMKILQDVTTPEGTAIVQCVKGAFKDGSCKK